MELFSFLIHICFQWRILRVELFTVNLDSYFTRFAPVNKTTKTKLKPWWKRTIFPIRQRQSMFQLVLLLLLNNTVVGIWTSATELPKRPVEVILGVESGGLTWMSRVQVNCPAWSGFTAGPAGDQVWSSCNVAGLQWNQVCVTFKKLCAFLWWLSEILHIRNRLQCKGRGSSDCSVYQSDGKNRTVSVCVLNMLWSCGMSSAVPAVKRVTLCYPLLLPLPLTSTDLKRPNG